MGENERDEWWVARKDLPDGRTLFLVEQIYDWKLTIGYGETFWDDAFCYGRADLMAAFDALLTWDGTGDAPGPWTRHQLSGRRRPNGDPAKEYVPEF